MEPMDKKYRDAVADGISLTKGELSPAAFGENFRSGLYDNSQIASMFRYGREFFDYDFSNGFKYLDTGKEQAEEFLSNDKAVNTAVAKSLYHTFTQLEPNSRGESYDRKFEESQAAAKALGLLAEGFSEHSSNFKEGTAFELYFYPFTMEKNSRNAEALYRSSGWAQNYDINTGVSKIISEQLKQYSGEISGRTAVPQRQPDDKAPAGQALHRPEETKLAADKQNKATVKPTNFVSAAWAKLKGMKR